MDALLCKISDARETWANLLQMKKYKLFKFQLIRGQRGKVRVVLS